MKAFVILSFLFNAAWYMTSALAEDALPPDQMVRKIADDVLAAIHSDKELAAGDRKKALALAEQKILPHVDFRRMTMLAVGRFWRKATPDQQEQLIKEFRALLVRTYSNSLTTYKNQTVDVKPLELQPGDTDVMVQTEIKKPGAPIIPIDYRMEKNGNEWKAYDIAVDGVSLVTTYRSSFADEVRKGGVESLLKSLVEKNQAGVIDKPITAEDQKT